MVKTSIMESNGKVEGVNRFTKLSDRAIYIPRSCILLAWLASLMSPAKTSTRHRPSEISVSWKCHDLLSPCDTTMTSGNRLPICKFLAKCCLLPKFEIKYDFIINGRSAGELVPYVL